MSSGGAIKANREKRLANAARVASGTWLEWVRNLIVIKIPETFKI